MGDGRRAAWSAALLAGFWLAAWLQVVLAIAVVLGVLMLLPSEVALRVGAPLCIATAGLLGFATARALRIRRAAPAGVPVTRQDAPALWELADKTAAAAQVPPPDAIVVIADARVVLIERYRVIGLLGGRRELHIGLPLLQAWSPNRLRAAVAHELAHGSPALGRFAPMAHRGRHALGRIVPRIPRGNPAGPLLRVLAGVFRRIDAPLARAHELAADRIAAELAGERAVAAVLQDGPAMEGMQQVFYAEYLSAGWQAGYVPEDIFGGMLRVMAARADELAVLRTVPQSPPGAWDPHPPLADRLAALAELSNASSPGTGSSASPAGTDASAGTSSSADASSTGSPGSGDSSGSPGSESSSESGSSLSGSATVAGSSDSAASSDSAGSAGSPGSAGSSGSVGSSGSAGSGGISGAAASSGSLADRDLVPDLPGLGRALQAVAFPVDGRTPVSWDDFFTVARNTEMDREADASLQAVSRAVGVPVKGPDDVLDLVADGRLRKAAEVLFPGLPPAETHDRVVDLITLLLALAALRSSVARWRHSWSGTAELVAIDGSHLVLAEPAILAADPATVDQARKLLERLEIDLAAGGIDNPDRTPARVPVLGGVVNVLVDGARTDVLVIETGFVLVPSLPRSRNTDSKRRLFRLASAGVRADGSLAAEMATEMTGLLAALTGNTGAFPIHPGEASVKPPEPRDPGEVAVWKQRFVRFSDITEASSAQGRRRQWEMTLANGNALTIRPTLDSDELQGGWASLDEALAYVTRTRIPAGSGAITGGTPAGPAFASAPFAASPVSASSVSASSVSASPATDTPSDPAFAPPSGQSAPPSGLPADPAGSVPDHPSPEDAEFYASLTDPVPAAAPTSGAP